MSTVKILHCADIHIGAAESFLKEKADSRRFETLITFEKIVDLAKEHSVQVVALAGDILDSNNIEKTFIRRILEKISQQKDIKFVFAAGNHDPLDFASPFKDTEIPENLYVLSTQGECIIFDDIKVNVFGKSFEGAFLKGTDKFNIQMPDNDYVNLMVQHGELSSDLNSRYNAITQEFIKSSEMDYIALGHIHKRSQIGKLCDTYFAYSGCPEGQGFDELGQKGVYIGEIGKGSCLLEFIPVAKRLHICEKVDVTSVPQNEIADRVLSQLKEKYGEEFTDNLYKIVLTGSVSPESEASLAEIESRLNNALYFAKVVDKTEYLIDYEALSKEASLKGIFVKNMISLIEKADENQVSMYKNALKIGLKAFNSEVGFNED
ncbi:MAG: metallophosphoesterase [Clostridia bacterium]|nr:metallophosphoesterase [Clostridia bacterium]